MLEQVSRLSDGDYEQSLMVQLFLDCVDRATASSTAFVSFQEQPMHFNDNQTLNVRVVDPIADDGCNSCCHGEDWRQNAETKMKVLGLAAKKGKYFQWRRNEHDNWKVGNSHGHTTARVRHGDTHVRGII